MSQQQVRTTIAVLSGVLAAGCAVMAVAHAGVELPLLSQLGPGGDDAVWLVVILFSLGALVLAFVVIGASRARAWAWALGLVVHAVIVLFSLLLFRGAGTLVAIVISVVSLALLLSRGGRASLLPA